MGSMGRILYDIRVVERCMKTKKNNFTKRLSYRRHKKMWSHVDELEAFVLENIRALKNMIKAGIKEERNRWRKNDKVNS